MYYIASLVCVSIQISRTNMGANTIKGATSYETSV
jgi:hypothetical protein